MNTPRPRLYIKQVVDYMHIVHRYTHQLIWTGSVDSVGKAKLIELSKMPLEQFYELLWSQGIKPKPLADFEKEIDGEKEKWYQGAWSYTHIETMNKLKIDLAVVPEEIPPFELLAKLRDKGYKNWGLESRPYAPENVEETIAKQKLIDKEQTQDRAPELTKTKLKPISKKKALPTKKKVLKKLPTKK